MAKDEHKNVDDPEIDPELELVRKAHSKGTANVVGEILNDPQVRNTIKRALLAETIKNSIVLTCFLVGLLKLYDVSKTVVGFDWKGDLAMSIVLISVGLTYMIRNLMKVSKQADSKS